MSDMTVCLNDLSYIPLNNEQNEPTQGDISETSNKPTQAKRNVFEEVYASANEELYPGCDYVTRLDFMAKFTHFKVKGKLTDSIFNEMLEFFQMIFPPNKGYMFPPSYYEIKMTFKMIGLGYESKNACVNDCFLFRGEINKDKQFCPVRNTSIWKDIIQRGRKFLRRPTSTPISLNSYVVNSVRFVVYSHDECRKTQNNGICSPGEKDEEMYYCQLEKILAFSLNDSDFATLNIDGQSMDVNAPPDIIDVDEDDDFIDDEVVVLYDLAYDHAAQWSNLLGEIVREHIGIPRSTIGLILRKLAEPFKMLKTKQRARSSADRDPSHLLSSNICRWRPPRLESTCPSSRPTSTHILMVEEMIRLRDLGFNTPMGVPYTEDQIIAMVRKGKQQGHIPSVGRVLARQGRDAISISEPRYTHTHVDVDELESQHGVGGGSGSGGGGDDKPSTDKDAGGDDDADRDEES
nr:hypothetical protein [Tanacetum cinerariifolium]